jgi:alpha-mannosidase
LSWSRKALIPLSTGINGAMDQHGNLLIGQKIRESTYIEIEVPACGWTTIQPAGAVESEDTSIVIGKNMLENENMRVIFNENGEITSLYDKVCNQECMAGTGNIFELYKDVPTNFDAWDIDSMVYQTPVSTSVRESRITVQADGSLVGILRLETKINHSTVIQEISLRKGSGRLEFKTSIDWQERHKLLKVGFPTTMHANEAIHEIQFGHIRRPNHASRPFDADRFEVSNHKWSALAEEKRGFAILNDCKYGLNVNGNSIHLTLLKSAMAPDMNADRGLHQFTYAVFVWNGSFADCSVVKEAYELNCPPNLVLGDGGEGSVFTVNPDNIIIETVKPAEDGSKDLILRLYESKRTATRCEVTISLPLSKVYQTNMLEDTERELDVQNQCISLNFRAFEIKTIRLVLI